MNGIIVKALSGFYYVRTEDGLITCRARGIFRKTGETPLVGDRVTISLEGQQGTVDTILPRRNVFVRPAIANLDMIVIFASAAVPVTDPFLIDRMTVTAERQKVPAVLCINKMDLDPADELTTIYRRAGMTVVNTSAETGEGVDALRTLIRGKTAAFTGNSGVGKSTLLQKLCPSLALETGEVSRKLGRGRHTTRHIELYPIGDETYIADTPGFSSFETEQTAYIPKEELQQLFPDFRPYLGGCRFQDCSHRTEPGCTLLQALQEHKVEASRHESYKKLYAAAEQIKPWELKQP